MERKLTRRQFGQLAIASAAVAGIGSLANKTWAQTSILTPNLGLIGVNPVPNASTSVGIALQSLDLALNQILNLRLPQAQFGARPILQIGEQLAGFTSLANGTLVLGISPVRAGRNESAATRLVFVGGSSANTPLTVSGLGNQNTLESLLVTNNGSLLGLAIKKNFRPPADLVSINLNTGQTSLSFNLPNNERFSNLAQCPDGRIYTTSVGRLGETSLVQLNVGQGQLIRRAQLNFNGTVWTNGFSDLVCSEAGQLFALGAPRYVTPNNLYSVDPSTGAMTLLRQYDAAKITISST